MAFLWIAAVILLMGCCVVCALVWHRGPLIWLYGRRLASLPGNAAQYSPEAVTRVEGSALAGKHIIFLGSSVTYGAAAMGVSFADYVCARTGATMTKEAVSGTTLADDRPDSYVARLKRLDGSIPADLFVCRRRLPRRRLRHSDRGRSHRVHHLLRKRDLELPRGILHQSPVRQ